MNFIELLKSYEGLKTATLLVALIVALISKIVKKYISIKALKVTFPFVLGIVLYFVYYLIFVGNPFSDKACALGEVVVNGVLCGTLSSTYIFAFEYFSGNKKALPKNPDVTYLAIFAVIKEYSDANAESIAQKIVDTAKASSPDNNIEEVIFAILKDSLTEITDAENKYLATLITEIIKSY